MYIDPNTGGMLFQTLAVLFGLFSGIILFFSSRIRMMAAQIVRRVRRDENEIETNSADEPKPIE